MCYAIRKLPGTTYGLRLWNRLRFQPSRGMRIHEIQQIVRNIPHPQYPESRLWTSPQIALVSLIPPLWRKDQWIRLFCFVGTTKKIFNYWQRIIAQVPTSGTSFATILDARPSKIAVLPTPGGPMSLRKWFFSILQSIYLHMYHNIRLDLTWSFWIKLQHSWVYFQNNMYNPRTLDSSTNFWYMNEESKYIFPALTRTHRRLFLSWGRAFHPAPVLWGQRSAARHVYQQLHYIRI